MRWPLQRRPRPTEHPPVVPADAPSPTLADPSVPAPTGSAVASHQGSRPRADWAHLAPVATATRVAAPLTFDGHRFGRSVAGSRSLTERRQVLGHAPGPAGVLVDAARVDAVLPPDTVMRTDPTAASPASEVHGPALAHRKPAVTPAPARDLLASDADIEFPRTELGGPPPAPVTWTPDTGFVEVDEPGRAPTRIIRRPRIGDDTEEPGTDDGDEPDEASGPSLRFVAAPGPRRMPAPRDLADLVEQHTGVNVADAEIDRSPAVSDRAAQLGAIAFTEHGTVHLPDELGPLDDPAVRAVAAHELVHVAQQRARGGAPSEDSHEGRELERQARAVQHRVATDAVRPTFLRSGADAPTRLAGVQRLANEHPDWVGEDLSDRDYSDVEPRSASDPFAWQERDGEPTGDWEARQRWARSFEQDNGTTLQARRDARYQELLAAAGQEPAAVPQTRHTLEQELPYQFGPPFGIAPYPDTTAADPTAVAGAVGTAGELRAASVALGRISDHAHLVHRTAGSGRVDRSDLEEVFERRFERERTLRRQVLEAKRRAAADEHAAADHVVVISPEELQQIREAVELELPLDVPYPQYLETDENLTMSVAGEVDVPAPPAHAARPGGGPARSAAGGIAAGLPGATTRTSTGAGSGSAPATAANAPAAGGAGPAHTDSTTGGAEATGATSALLQRLHDTQHAVPAATVDADHGDLVARFEERFDREREYRRNVLADKVRAAVEAGATAGVEVSITAPELQLIRDMVDTELPVDVPYPQYLESDEDLSREITEQDITDHAAARQQAAAAPGAATAPATPAAPTGAAPSAGQAAATPAATPVTAAAPAAVGAHDEHATAAGGDHAAPDPYADHALAGRVVESLSEQDVDVLSRRVWARLRRELRGELLIDRERSGTLADLR